MGTGASSQKHRRECPQGYDKGKFKMILQLYDKLDSDGDNVIDINELKNIAHLHINNKITVRKLDTERIMKNTKLDLELLDSEFKNKKERIIAEITSDYEKKKRDIITVSQSNLAKNKQEIRVLEGMDAGAKNDSFMDVVSDDKLIDFWEFYEYMKNRTGDIINIEFD
jgi:hypothetical protein